MSLPPMATLSNAGLSSNGIKIAHLFLIHRSILHRPFPEILLLLLIVALMT